VNASIVLLTLVLVYCNFDSISDVNKSLSGYFRDISFKQYKSEFFSCYGTICRYTYIVSIYSGTFSVTYTNVFVTGLQRCCFEMEMLIWLTLSLIISAGRSLTYAHMQTTL